MNCEVCYHKKVCGKIQREGCADFKDEEKVFEIELPLGTPYYTIEKRYFCDVADDEDFGDCPDEAIGAEVGTKYWFSYEAAQRELERRKEKCQKDSKIS